MIEVVVLGGKGRLGSAIVAEAKSSLDLHLKAVVERQGSLKAAASKGDVVIDATLAPSVAGNLEMAMEIGTPYVLAVTGYGPEVEKIISDFSKKLPVLVAPNLSAGVAILREAVVKAAAILTDAKIEIVETHHKNKKDSPSGTARSLAEATGRKDVKIQSIRKGDVIGEHIVRFLMDGEELEFKHVAQARTIFAKGALRAAKFVAGRSPGMYTLRDTL